MATNQTVFWPSLNPVVTEEAGTRGGGHMGLDLAANRGDSVIAPFDGVVIYAGGDGASGYLAGTNIWANGQAKVVRIRRADGLIAHLAHLDTIEVAAGQAVKAGQRVGGAGDTGWSTGVHIHWELRWDESWNGGNWINPRSVNPVVFGSQPAPAPTSQKRNKQRRRRRKNRREEEMMFIYLQDGVKKGEHSFAVFRLGQKGSWFEFSGQPSANQLADQLGSAMRVWPGPWNDLKKRHQ